MRDLTKDHDAHDRLRISALVAGDLDGAEQAAAEEQLKSCTECARLAADLRTVAVSLASMPVPPRPRDFRLSERDLGRHPARRWSMEGVRRGLRPAGTALAALGIAGLLLAGTTALGGLASFGSSGAAAPAAAPPRDANFEARPSAGAAGAAASAGASPAAAAATGAPQPVNAGASSAAAPSPAAPGVLAAPSGSPSAAARGAATADKSTDQGGQAGPIPAPAPPPGPSPLVIASVALLAAGIGFLVASRFLRPRGDPPD
jgi:hypothetical protein